MYFIGLGIASIFCLLMFAVKDVPPAISGGGIALGIVFVLWDLVHFDARYNGPLAMAAAAMVLAAGAAAWLIAITGVSGSVAERQEISVTPRSKGLGQQGRIAPKTQGTTANPTSAPSQADGERISSELYLLSKILDEAQPLAETLGTFLQRHPQQLTVTMSVVDARAEAIEMRAQYSAVIKELNEFLEASAYDRKVLVPIVAPFKSGDDPLNRINGLLQQYLETLNSISPAATNAEIFSNPALWGIRSQLQSRLRASPNWIAQARTAISAKRAELR